MRFKYAFECTHAGEYQRLIQHAKAISAKDAMHIMDGLGDFLARQCFVFDGYKIVLRAIPDFRFFESIWDCETCYYVSGESVYVWLQWPRKIDGTVNVCEDVL